jgi:hypothetical protein
VPRSALTSFAALLACALAVSTPARAAGTRVVKGPFVTALSDTSAEIRFELDAPGVASVSLRKQGGDAGAGAPRTLDAPGDASLHVVRASGLEPSTRYTYSVTSGGKAAGEGTFATAPRPGAAAPITFLVYGDDRTDHAAHAAVVRAMAAVPSDFLVHTGDLVEMGASDEQWQTFFDIEGDMLRARPIFAAVGNHELHGDPSGSHFARLFGEALEPGGAPKLYGTARVGALRLFWIDAMHAWDSGEERAWLEGALARADAEPGVVWRVVVAHHGPWSSGPHGPNAHLIDAHVPELLAAHGVQLFLAGHDHLYERGDGGALKYVVTGGAGAPLYAVREKLPSTRRVETAYHFVEIRLAGDDLRLVAHRVEDGGEIERCGFRVGQPWDCDPPAGQAAPGGDAAPSPPAAPPPAAPVAAAGASASRCACDVPGRSSPGGVPGAFALGGVLSAAVWIARRRRRG